MKLCTQGGTNAKCLEHYNNIIMKNHFLLLFGFLTSCMFSTPNCMNLSMFPLFRRQLLVESVTTLDLSPKHYQLQDKLDSWLLGSSHSGTVFISDLSFFLCTLTKKGSRIRMEEQRGKSGHWLMAPERGNWMSTSHRRAERAAVAPENQNI